MKLIIVHNNSSKGIAIGVKLRMESLNEIAIGMNRIAFKDGGF
jgi:hypothetical protein